MRNLDNITAENLLRIESPELLFSFSQTEAKREYRMLAQRWHPDKHHSPQSEQVFAHIAILYKWALEKFKSGDWCEPAEKIECQKKGWQRFRLNDGSLITCKYRSHKSFELGEIWVCDNAIVFELPQNNSSFFENGRKRMHLLTFRDEPMLLEMAKYLPTIEGVHKTAASQILVICKTPDQLNLGDALGYFRSAIEPLASIGWILNGLLNIACYLEWAGLNHNSISVENVYISPLRHSVTLLGGWWYATKSGEPLSYLPETTFKNLPPDIVRTKISDRRIDLECIKHIGRKIVGTPDDTPQKFLAHVPEPIADWLTLPATESARAEYRNFKEVLFDSFGPPKFIDLNLNANLLYKE
ncbi:MAG TPA: J domain-containing protein [Drouetiella sp.]